MTTKTSFPIVGVGASAGGLSALKSLFATLPPNTNAAYVVISHLDPHGKSLTAQILGRDTQMPVIQVTDGLEVQPDHVYVIPPNAYLTLSGKQFKLSEIALRHGLRMPVDVFFESLAEQCKENAVGIVLSGTGSDGSLGVVAIASQGGLVLVQSPDTAQYDGMPNNAIASGSVDLIYPVEQLAGRLAHFLQHHASPVPDEHRASQLPETDASTLRSIVDLLHKKTGHDFNNYRMGTMSRRVSRRMALFDIPTYRDYLKFLAAEPHEADELFKNLLIGVTDFFRDGQAFDALNHQVITKLVAKKSNAEPIRIWVPACASGEEAYSIAILVLEELERTNKRCELTLFATDIDDDALAVARAGVYPETRLAAVSEQRRERFFRKLDHNYQVNQKLRSCVTFAAQNIIVDPPFPKLDLVSCRNLLIYLGPQSQAKVLAMCHFALAENGFLLLGTSETIGQQSSLFSPVDKKWHIYRKLKAAKTPIADLTPVYPKPGIVDRSMRVIPQPSDEMRWKALLQRHLLQAFGPAAALINTQYDVLYFHGPTNRFLEQPSGTPTRNLLLMTHHELRQQLRAGLSSAMAEEKLVSLNNIKLQRDDRQTRVKIEIRPITDSRLGAKLLLVTFEELAEAGQAPSSAAAITSEASVEEQSIIQHLKQELNTTQEQLRSNIDELETTNEELQAANEELMSINEELQSSNEELESSKEELQSMNEEMVTMNAQLKESLDEQAALNDNLNNLITSTEIPTLFLDRKFRIGRFTPAIKQLLHLIDTDIGRPISDIQPLFFDGELLEDARTVQEKLSTLETEVYGEDGRCYIRRISPYRTSDNRIAGTVITFIDITSRKQAEEKTRLIATLVRDSNDAITIQQLDGKITAWNRGAAKLYGRNEREALAMNIESIIPEDERSHYREMTEKLRKGIAVPSLETRRLAADGSTVDIWLTMTPLTDASGEVVAIATTEHDLTPIKEAQRALYDARLKTDLAERSMTLAIASHDLRQPLQSLSLMNSALLKIADDPEIRKILQLERATLNDMRWLLNVLMDTSKLDSGTTKIAKDDIEIAPILERLHAELTSEAKQKGLEFVVSAANATGFTDAGLLAQLIRNLVGNAIRYTDRGTVKLECESQNSHLLFSVSDTGKGIPADELESIFTEFHQVTQQESKDQSGLGLGLGLAIVARIAKLLDTEIEVQSTLGTGSVFSFSIPKGAARPGKALATETQGATSANSGAKILLVDDEASVRESTEMCLSMEGFQLMPAAAPAEAYSALTDFIPDLIITDLSLGDDDDGFDVITKIRSDTGRTIPAIVVTGNTSIAPNEVALEYCQLMHKPLKLEELLVVIDQLLASPPGSS